MTEHHQQGVIFSQNLKVPKPANPDQTPSYEGISIDESHLKSHHLAGAAHAKTHQSLEYSFIEHSLANRTPYKIDGRYDPLITTGDHLVNHPETKEGLDVTEIEGKEKSSKEIHTCREGQREIEKSCFSDLVIKKIGSHEEIQSFIVHLQVYDILVHPDSLVRSVLWNYTDKVPLNRFYRKRRYRKAVYRPLNESETITAFKAIFNGIDPSTGQTVSFSADQIRQVTPLILVGPKLRLVKHRHGDEHAKQFIQFEVKAAVQVDDFSKEWFSNCGNLEKRADQGDCEYASKHCTQGPETRIIEKKAFTEDCWQEQRIYSCQGVKTDTCTSLREKGCTQISSWCLFEKHDECVEWEHTFECLIQQGLQQTRISGKPPFCLDGNCTSQTWTPNQDMVDSLAKLAMFKEIQKDMDPNAQTVFKGKTLKCSRAIVNFKDCCVRNGWGMQMGLAGCNSQEKELAKQRKLKKCIRVGTYCDKKVLGKCVRKKTSYCCFASKLARIIHEQGRSQLGVSFGSGKHPRCQGLTLSQITQIDFTKIDLSELFQEILEKTKAPVMTRISEGIQSSMTEKTQLTPQQDTTQGRTHGQF
jgi:type-F conjugative transfer system mating-pair stabilization protein TraN